MYSMQRNNQKMIPRRMVRIEEDEEECLRRLAETSTNTRYYHEKVVKNGADSNKNYMSSRLSSDNNKVQDIHIIADHDHDHDLDQYYFLHEEKKVITQMPNKKEKKAIAQLPEKKLETKKSEDINESAEKFIQKFKHQLILQRLESLDNVEKMIERGH